MNYDLIVIGGGPAGYLAAERAAEAGLKTMLAEKNTLGGVCLNEGCVPTKTLLYSAKMFDHVSREGAKFGIHAQGLTFDHPFVIGRKDKIVRSLVAAVRAKMKQHHVDVVNAEAKILGKDSEGFAVFAGGSEYKSRFLLVASGSETIVPDIEGLKASLTTGFALTSREALALKELPASIVVVGGGVIGLELASYYKAAGCEVSVIEMLGQIGGPTDTQIAANLQKNLTKKGIRFYLNAKAVKIQHGVVAYEQEGVTQEIACEKVIISIGRRAVTQGLGLENLGVETDRGAIKTDLTCRTNVENLFAAGDVNGKSMLAHTAYRESEVAVNNMAGQKDFMNYSVIPSVIYTDPEIGGVGETEQSAKAKGLHFIVKTVSMNYSGRYFAENESGDGICKLIVDEKNNTLIGVHMIGSYASEIIYGAALMVAAGFKIKDYQKLVFPHPTVAEIIREAMFI
jgi:dihydrolipoamide dehydrogenase